MVMLLLPYQTVINHTHDLSPHDHHRHPYETNDTYLLV